LDWRLTSRRGLRQYIREWSPTSVLTWLYVDVLNASWYLGYMRVDVFMLMISLPQRGSIGDRMFTSGWQLTLMKRMKKRLTETADHYRSLACNADAAGTADSTHTAPSAQRRDLYQKLDRSVLLFAHCWYGICLTKASHTIEINNF